MVVAYCIGKLQSTLQNKCTIHGQELINVTVYKLVTVK